MRLSRQLTRRLDTAGWEEHMVTVKRTGVRMLAMAAPTGLTVTAKALADCLF
jgi:hypothetical protein